jgi:hypothetical protein
MVINDSKMYQIELKCTKHFPFRNIPKFGFFGMLQSGNTAVSSYVSIAWQSVHRSIEVAFFFTKICFSSVGNFYRFQLCLCNICMYVKYVGRYICALIPEKSWLNRAEVRLWKFSLRAKLAPRMKIICSTLRSSFAAKVHPWGRSHVKTTNLCIFMFLFYPSIFSNQKYLLFKAYYNASSVAEIEQ